MARSLIVRVVDTEIDGTQFLAIARFLRTDTGAEERAKGGLWVKAEDRDALVIAAKVAVEFALACKARVEALDSKPAPAPAPTKAARAPKQAPPKPAPAPTKAAPAPEPTKAAPVPMCNDASHADNAKAGARFCPLCGKDLTIVARSQAVAQARANKPAPAPRTSKPAPEPTHELTAEDYERLIGI